MRRPLLWLAAGVVVAAAVSPFLFAVPALPDRGNQLPTTTIARSPLKLTVYANGEVRAGRTATLVAPPAGGTLRLVTLRSTGTNVKAGDVVFEIDPADQEFALAQARSEMAEAEQQIVKTKADSAVQAAEDTVALLTAGYDVRRGELDSAANDKAAALTEAATVRQAKGDIGAERARLLAEAAAQAESLVADFDTRLEAEIADLHTRAAADIETAKGRQSDELRAEISRLSSAAAERAVAESIDDATHQQLIEAFIQKAGSMAGSASV